MNDLKNNKKVIIICIILILLSLITFFIIKKKNNSDEYYFYDDSSKLLKDYKINEVIPIFVNTEQIVKKYLAEYVNFMLYYPEKAYELLDEEYKIENFDNLESFKKYINSIKSLKLEHAEVSKYSVGIYKDKSVYYIVDNSGNNYKFIEESLMDYSVIIN